MGLLRFECESAESFKDGPTKGQLRWFTFSRCNPSLPSISQCSRQESNLVYDLRKVACYSGTLREHGWLIKEPSNPSRNRTWSDSFEDCHAIQHTHESYC